MTNLCCNNCQTLQKAKVAKILIPSTFPHYSELSSSYLLIIEKCKKCSQKKIFSLGLFHTGYFIEFGFIKNKLFSKIENNIIEFRDNLPSLINKETTDKKGFYLNYNEFGKVKRCYSNLSSINLGLDSNWDREYAKLSTVI